jgi:hypothetical protein
MTGAFGNTSTEIVSSCLYISSATTNADIRNNIFYNIRTGNDSKNYAVHSPNTTTFLNINNNDYWTTGSVIGYFGADVATFNDWKTATGQDINSVSKEVFFVSTTDLHLTGTSNGDYDLAGTPITGITTDIDGDVRHTTFPYMGSDEASIPLPVELNSFNAAVVSGDVHLEWTTSTEINNSGFEVERSDGGEFVNIGFIKGNGTTTEPHSYSFIDTKVRIGAYSYRLKQIDFNGAFTYSNIIETDITAPLAFTLSQNYPNPFNPSTIIEFAIPDDAKNVTLTIYNALGEKIAGLVNSSFEPGYYQYQWNAENYASGLYIYELRAESATDRFVSIKKMLLMK